MVGERLTDQLRSVSHDNVAALLLFLDRLIFQTGKYAPPLMTMADGVDADHNLVADATTCLSSLRSFSARGWLRRYQEISLRRSISFELFRKEVRWLSRFHVSLQPSGFSAPCIPLSTLLVRQGSKTSSIKQRALERWYPAVGDAWAPTFNR